MDCMKVGSLIRELRRAHGLTQAALAEKMHISDKAVSKWERGLGCPDVSLLPVLSRLLGVNLEELLEGELGARELVGGNMKRLKFYVCPDCGNMLTAFAEAAVYCCGKKLEPVEPQKAAEGERLSVESIENDYYISSPHEMTKEHHISFLALLTGDTLILRKQYPEWDLSARIPRIAHGKLVWLCTRHGLMYQLI